MARLSRKYISDSIIWTYADPVSAAWVFDFVRDHRSESILHGGAMRSQYGRHGVYFFDDPQIGSCVIKEYGINLRRGLWKRIESWATIVFGCRELRTLKVSQRLKDIGVSVPLTLAAWMQFYPKRRAFLLYWKLEGVPLENHWSTYRCPALRPDQPIPDEAMMSYMRTLGATVRRMHRNGIVHEDLQSSNILVSPSLDGTGEVGIIDIDSAYCPVVFGKRARFTSYVKSLVRFSWCFESMEDPFFAEFVKAYTEGDEAFSAAFLKAISFWRSRYKKNHHISTLMAWLLCPPPPKWRL